MGRTSTARDRLVEAMAGLAHRHGYSNVSVDEICAAADVKKGSFYHFFPSKRELMLAALDHQHDQARDGILADAFDPARPPLDRITHFLTTVAEYETRSKKAGGHVLGCPFGGAGMNAAVAEPTVAARADKAFTHFIGLVQGALEEAQETGEVGPDVDVREAAEAILAYFQGMEVVAKTRNDPGVVRRLARRAVLLATGTLPAGAAASRKAPARRTRR